MKRIFGWGIPAVILFMAAGIFLFSSLFMFLWNSILPAVLHVGTITLWQAAGILVLSRILFGGFRKRRAWRHGYDEKRWEYCDRRKYYAREM